MFESKRNFLATFLADPDVAAISPSSKFLIDRLMRKLPNLPQANLAVEFGAGDGVATRAMLALLPPSGRFVAIEKNPRFAARLRELGDARLDVIEGDCVAACSDLIKKYENGAAVIVASVPFTYLSAENRHKMAAAAKKLLAPGGVFIVFHQYTPLMFPYLRRHFRDVKIEFEPLNVFPCFLLRCQN